MALSRDVRTVELIRHPPTPWSASLAALIGREHGLRLRAINHPAPAVQLPWFLPFDLCENANADCAGASSTRAMVRIAAPWPVLFSGVMPFLSELSPRKSDKE
jgi:hypothetical protein